MIVFNLGRTNYIGRTLLTFCLSSLISAITAKSAQSSRSFSNTIVKENLSLVPWIEAFFVLRLTSFIVCLRFLARPDAPIYRWLAFFRFVILPLLQDALALPQSP